MTIKRARRGSHVRPFIVLRFLLYGRIIYRKRKRVIRNRGIHISRIAEKVYTGKAGLI